MIAEDLLERGLAGLASDYDVPPEGPAHIRDQLMAAIDDDGNRSSRWKLRNPSPRGWLVMAAAALVVIVIASFAVGGGGTSSDNVESASSAGGGASAGVDQSGTGFRKIDSGNHAPLAAPSPLPAHRAAAAAVPGAGLPSSVGTTVGGGSAAQAPIAPVPSAPSKVIKTGELDLQVPKGRVSTALNLLTGIATLERGFIADSRTSEGGGAPSGTITMRVPVAAFDDAVKRARTIGVDGVKVLSLQTSGKDVTSKYVDLKARISALKKTRETFLTLLSKATTIGQTLAVQQHVTDVQTQIEQLQGQKKVLVNQAALSTLTVTVDQKVPTAEAAPPHHKSGLHKAVDRSVSRFVHGIEAIIGILGPLLLVALLVGVAWLAARFAYRRLRRRMV